MPAFSTTCAPGTRIQKVATFEWYSTCDEAAQFPILISERTLKIEPSGGFQPQFRGDLVQNGDGEFAEKLRYPAQGKWNFELMRSTVCSALVALVL
jgi:hypothetical protein